MWMRHLSFIRIENAVKLAYIRGMNENDGYSIGDIKF